MNMAEFFHMGGYGAYVWSCYGITAIILIANLVMPLRTHKKLLADIRKQLATQKDKNAPAS